MSDSKVPINRIGKFFGPQDYELNISFGTEWLHGWMNFTLVLYRVDRYRSNTDDIYGETSIDGIKYLPPVEFKGYVQILQPENKYLGTSKIDQMEPGNLKVGVYQKDLVDLDIDINYGDYIGYYETEDRVRYYVVNNDGRVTSDNKHSYGGYKSFYRSIIASPITSNEFRGL